MPAHNRYTTAYASFYRPRTPDGLAVQSVYAFFQDSVGFMWVGTQRGLVRVDSHNVRSFLPDPELPFSIPGKFILALGEDLRGDIWVGMYDGGAARYDALRERFYPVDLQPRSQDDLVVRSFAAMDDGRMWIAAHGSLTAVDTATGLVCRFQHPEVAETSHNKQNRFIALLRVDERTLLVGTAVGLFFFDTLLESFRHLPYNRRNLITRFGNGVVTLARSGTTIIAATRDQLYALNDERNGFDLIEPLLNVPGDEAYWVVQSLEADSVEGRFWIGTETGILRLDRNDGAYSFFPPNDTTSHAPYGLEIHALARDRSGTLWIGTGAGISFLDLRYNFQYGRVTDERGAVTDNAMTLACDHDGKIWVGTPQGLFEYDVDTGDSVRHALGGESEQQTRDGNAIREIHVGKREWWIGTIDGLFRWDPNERKVLEHFLPNHGVDHSDAPRRVLGPQIKGILEDSKGFVWSGSDALGIQRYDVRTGTFRYYLKEQKEESEGRGREGSGGLPHDTMMTCLEDQSGRLWFGFVTCLALYNRATDTFRQFVHNPADKTSLSNNMVLALCEDSRGQLWVGTAGGLNRVVEKEDGTLAFVRYGIRQGLPVDFIVSILEHGESLWLGTNRGIVRFRESEPGVRGEARLYDVSDGLHDSEYALASAIKDAKGFLCFGGGAGFDRFHPDHLRSDTIPPPVVLTELRLFNRPVPVTPPEERTDNEFALDSSLVHLRELQLSYRHSVFTLCYAALHYLQPEKITFQYRLVGFDRAWIDAGGKTEVTYTNLDPGDYTFLVRAANSDGVFSRHPAELLLRISPPPWRTWWAHLLYGTAGVGAVASFTRWRIGLRERELREQRRVELAREEEREKIRRQNAADFHDEAGTTLTRILFLTELARRRGQSDPELQQMLEKIDANAARLSQGMRDFIWVLDPDKDTLLDTLQRIETAAEALFAHRDTSFSMRYVHQELQPVTLNLNQRRQTLMICKEALHNAARHARARSVLVQASFDGKSITIAIVDDGCGISTTPAVSGYGIKSMRRRAESIAAGFVLESEEGKGTVVELKIPHLGN